MLRSPSTVARLTLGRLAVLVSLAAVPMALALAIEPGETKAPSHSPADDSTAKAAAQPVNSDGDEVPVARKSPDALTPEQVVKQQPKGKATVQFRVDSVWVYGMSEEEMANEDLPGKPAGSHGGDPPICLGSSAELPNGGKFYVQLAGHAMRQAGKDVQYLAAKEDQGSLCPYRLIKPLRTHFTGKTIRATGKLEHTNVPRRVREDGTVEGPMSDEYVLRVGSPGDFRVLPSSEEGANSAKGADVLTPEQVVKQQPTGKVTVRFRVASVGLQGWSDQMLKELLQGTLAGEHGGDPPIRLESASKLPKRTKFVGVLSGDAQTWAAKEVQHLAPEEDKDSLCVVRLIRPLQKHFTGKTIRATGELEHTKVPRRVREDGTVEGPWSDEYALRVDSPGDFQVLPGAP